MVRITERYGVKERKGKEKIIIIIHIHRMPYQSRVFQSMLVDKRRYVVCHGGIVVPRDMGGFAVVAKVQSKDISSQIAG